jgi:hypothetical protein
VQARTREVLARQPLVRARTRRVRRVAREPQRFRDARPQHHGAIADGEDAVHRTARRLGDHGFHCGVFFVKTDRNGAIAPRVFERVTPVGDEDQLDPERLGRVAERSQLVACGR